MIISRHARFPSPIAIEASRRTVADRNRLTGREVFFDRDKVIVSKTDLKGTITYANETFIEISGFSEVELLGAPHSILRHPGMPRCVFKFLWDTIAAGSEVFAYVLNRTRQGDHYWVFAHVTPSRDRQGAIIGYHSNRRVPEPAVVRKIEPLYHSLLQAEAGAASPKDAVERGSHALAKFIEDSGMSYSQLIFSL